METVETIFRKLRAENNRLREENYDLTLTFLLSKEKADDKIVRLQSQLKFLQDDDMGNMKTIDNLSKMAARLHKALDRIFNLHNRGDEYSEREINDMTYEIVVSALIGYDEGPRRDDRGDKLDGN
jgi:hypothetical protein